MTTKKQLDVRNYRVFTIRFLGPTDTRGARVKLIDYRHKTSKVIPYSYEHTTAISDAIVYLNSIGIKVVGKGGLNTREDVVFSNNFDIDIRNGKVLL